MDAMVAEWKTQLRTLRSRRYHWQFQAGIGQADSIEVQGMSLRYFGGFICQDCGQRRRQVRPCRHERPLRPIIANA